MHDVTEHYTEQEWEGDAGKHSRIGFFVIGNAIGVNNLLVDCCKFCRPKHGWHYQFRVRLSDFDVNVNALILQFCHMVQKILLPVEGDPEKSDRESSALFRHVESSVDCFFSGHELFVNWNQRVILNPEFTHVVVQSLLRMRNKVPQLGFLS